MNPYDQPTRITLDVSIKHWGKPTFEDEFFAELSGLESELPLDDMCSGRGYASPDGWAEFEDLKITKQSPSELEGSFQVSFTAEQPGGCRDSPGKFPVSGRLYFTLERKSRAMSIQPPEDYSKYGHE